jgi:hypothetical protein
MSSSTKSRNKSQDPKNAKRNRARKRDRGLSAGTADRLELYQRSVNSPEIDVDFVTETFKELRGRELRLLREDFCGTAAFAAEFLDRNDANSAEGFDLDPEPCDWGRKHNFGQVPDAATRMTWHLADVRSSADRPPEATVAFNFSYWCFKTRAELLGYFRAVREDLAEDGVFFLDLYGGPDSLIEQEEVRDIDGAFDYVWEQKAWEPGTGNYKTAIHFRFRDGTEMTDAFEYDWRFWGLTELKDALVDAGFTAVNSYFEGTDPDDENEGNGEFSLDPVGENCEAWLGYLVAEK